MTLETVILNEAAAAAAVAAAETVILREVSQRKTNIVWCCLYVESKKKKETNRLIYRLEVFIDVENNLLITRGKKGEGITWETGTDIYIHYI